MGISPAERFVHRLNDFHIVLSAHGAPFGSSAYELMAIRSTEVGWITESAGTCRGKSVQSQGPGALEEVGGQAFVSRDERLQFVPGHPIGHKATEENGVGDDPDIG